MYDQRPATNGTPLLPPSKSPGFCSNASGRQLARLHDADQHQLEQTSCVMRSVWNHIAHT